MSPSLAIKARLSLPVGLRRLSGWLFAIACCALAVPAWAAPKDRAALRKISETMTGDYAAGRYEQTEAILLGTDQACADRCSGPVKARIWLYIGCVRGTGNADQDGARAAFERALRLDPSLAPDPTYTSERTSASYRAARAGMGIESDAESAVHLEPFPPPTEQPSAPVARQAIEAPGTSLPHRDDGHGQVGVRLPGSEREGDEYQRGDPIPPGYHVEARVHRGLVIAGATVFGLGYTFAILGTAALRAEHRVGWEAAAVPVIGPWAATFTVPQPKNGGDCTYGCTEDIERALWVLDGLMQAAGAALLVVGLSVRRPHLVPNQTAKVTISLVRLGRSGYGLGMAGVF